MATFLARLGRASYRHRGIVATAWLAIVGAVLFLGTAAYGWVKREALRR